MVGLGRSESTAVPSQRCALHHPRLQHAAETEVFLRDLGTPCRNSLFNPSMHVQFLRFKRPSR